MHQNPYNFIESYKKKQSIFGDVFYPYKCEETSSLKETVTEESNPNINLFNDNSIESDKDKNLTNSDKV